MKEIDMKHFDKDFTDALEVFKAGDNQTLVFNVANDYVGRTFIKMIRKALNKDTYKVRVRGSQSDRQSYSASLKYADRLRVYIDNIGANKTLVDDSESSIRYLKDKILTLENGYDYWKKEYFRAFEMLNDLRTERQELKNEVDSYKQKYGNQELIDKWRDNSLIKFATDMYNVTNMKLQTLKSFMKASGLGLRDAKIVCDALVW